MMSPDYSNSGHWLGYRVGRWKNGKRTETDEKLNHYIGWTRMTVAM